MVLEIFPYAAFLSVIPAKAGIHHGAKRSCRKFAAGMDPSFRWDDDL
jgi:hypothetical protein